MKGDRMKAKTRLVVESRHKQFIFLTNASEKEIERAYFKHGIKMLHIQVGMTKDKLNAERVEDIDRFVFTWIPFYAVLHIEPIEN